MEQMKIAKWLKFFTIMGGFIGGLFFFWYVPIGLSSIIDMYPELGNFKYAGFLCLFMIAAFCYIALWNFYKICHRIGIGKSFCFENAQAMKNIGGLACAVLLILIFGTCFLGCIGYISGPFVVVMFFCTFVICGIIVICLALSKLIENAAKLKEENDLTI